MWQNNDKRLLGFFICRKPKLIVLSRNTLYNVRADFTKKDANVRTWLMRSENKEEKHVTRGQTIGVVSAWKASDDKGFLYVVPWKSLLPTCNCVKEKTQTTEEMDQEKDFLCSGYTGARFCLRTLRALLVRALFLVKEASSRNNELEWRGCWHNIMIIWGNNAIWRLAHRIIAIAYSSVLWSILSCLTLLLILCQALLNCILKGGPLPCCSVGSFGVLLSFTVYVSLCIM